MREGERERCDTYSYVILCFYSAAGISRSVTITTLYVMCVSSLGMEESLAVVRFCRDIANPNFGFRMQLKKFADEQLEKVRTDSIYIAGVYCNKKMLVVHLISKLTQCTKSCAMQGITASSECYM